MRLDPDRGPPRTPPARSPSPPPRCCCRSRDSSVRWCCCGSAAIGPLDLVLLAATYLLAGFGVTIGYHRLLTHRSFMTHRWVAYALAALGSMAAFGPVIDWVADHRLHHARTDRAGDPHSPHVPGRGALRGLWHAHVGWLFSSKGHADPRRYAPELLEDRGMRLINSAFPGPGRALGGAAGARRLGDLTASSPARSARARAPGSPGSSCSTTRSSASTRSGTPTVGGASAWTTAPPTCSRWRSCRWGSRGTTTTTRSLARPATGCAGSSSTCRASAIELLARTGLAWNVVRIPPGAPERTPRGARVTARAPALARPRHRAALHDGRARRLRVGGDRMARDRAATAALQPRPGPTT